MPWHQAIAVLEDGRVGMATNIGFYFYDETYSRETRRIDTYPLRFRVSGGRLQSISRTKRGAFLLRYWAGRWIRRGLVSVPREWSWRQLV